MANTQDKRFKDTLRRMLSTGPKPHKTSGKKRKSPDDPMAKDEPEKLVEWGKRNIQKD